MTPRRAGLAVGAAGAAIGGGGAALSGDSAAHIAALALLGALLGIAAQHPRAACLGAVAALLAVAPEGSLLHGAYLLVAAHAFAAGRWDGLWPGLGALVALVSAWEIGVAFGHDDAIPALFIPAAGWAAGRALRERAQVAARLAERAREVEEERETHAQLSVRYERARIASELHDIVAHAISVMVVQAIAGQRLARDPHATAEAFQVIAGAAREAEQDMARLVALLADEQATAHTPDLVLVEELIARARGSGLDVTLRLEGEREDLPNALVEAAYRVVQEGVTNALRYASGAAVTVLVRGDRDVLLVEVQNAAVSDETALAGSGTGTGLRGLRERAAALGGTLRAGPTPQGGWRLHARLPRHVHAQRP
ncbi:MAG: histidine kinase [Actinomycetota bacterium]|nr:histidine kinase [Actinomycetota bacterium]